MLLMQNCDQDDENPENIGPESLHTVPEEEAAHDALHVGSDEVNNL
jgi:hypothetical protein